MSFPPGAITVVPSLQEIIVLNADVPTFNASDFGDMSLDFIWEKSLFQTSILGGPPEEGSPRWRLSLVLDYNLRPALHGMIHQTLLAKRVEDASSTCSANCSYSLYFTGPYVQCTGTTNTSTLLYHDLEWPHAESFPIFNSSTEQFSIDYDFFDDPKIKDPPFDSQITISTSSPQNLGFRPLSKVDDLTMGQWKIDTINHYWTCIPSRADYTVHTTYKNNVRSLEVDIDEASIKPLISAPPSVIGVQEGDPPLSDTPFNPAVAPILRDANLYSIITPVMKTISGTFNATCGAFLGSNSTYTDSDGFEYYNFTTTFPPNGTYINPYKYSHNSTNDFMTILPIVQYFSDVQVSPSFSNISVNNGGLFTINETSINAMLQDVVLSIISYQPNNWTTRVNQKRNEIRNIYTFSRPLNLFLPYGLMLLGGLCAMGFGFYALRSNGVPATDGGFLQLFTTSQRSDTVDRIVRGGCLGGEENVSTVLKDLKIQFGELVETANGPEMAVLSTAGFGTEHEVHLLKRERIYGSL
ncbi:unnamed protein product [Penicillium crustosum]